jgi:hypothetical protein
VSAAETLRRLVVEEGAQLGSDPDRLRALLADEMPDEDESAELIVAAAEAGVPDDLAAMSKPPAAGWDEPAAARLTATGIAAGDAHWVVRVWAFGLGVDKTPPGPRPEDPSVHFTPADQHWQWHVPEPDVNDAPSREPPKLEAPQPEVPRPEVPRPDAPSRIRQHRVLIAAGAAAVVVTVLILLAVAGSPDPPSTGAAGPTTSSAGTRGGTASGGDTTPSTGTATSALPPLSQGFAAGFNVASAPSDPDAGPPPPDSGHWDCAPVKVFDTEIEAAECTEQDSDYTIRVERYGSPDDARTEFDSFDAPEQTRTTASPPPFECVESSYRFFANDGRAVYWAGVPYLVWFAPDDPAWRGRWMYAADLNCGIS